MILNIGGGGGVKPRIVVTAPTGSDVTVSKGSTILYAPEVSGTWTFNVPEQGDWSATAILGSKTASKTVSVSKVGVYNVTLRYVSTTLNDNSWEDIKSVADASEGQNYWAVGDTKQITINGKLSDGLTLSNYSTYVYIIGFDHNSSIEGVGIVFGGFKYYADTSKGLALCDSGYAATKYAGSWLNINNSNVTDGGWKDCSMRNACLVAMKNAFPSDLQSVIRTSTIYSDNVGTTAGLESSVTSTQDDVYLLAEYEIFGTRKYANQYEQNYQQQYAYYIAGNSKVMYRHSNPWNQASWWTRSLYVGTAERFCCVDGEGNDGATNTGSSYGLAPAFKVGSNPPPQPISNLAIGDIVKVKESGTDVDYIIVQQGNPDATMYDSSCDGTWLLRKDVYGEQVWKADKPYNSYELSDINTWLQNSFSKIVNVDSIVKTVKIPYQEGYGDPKVSTTSSSKYGADGLSCKYFLLAVIEVGFTTANPFPNGAKLDYFEQTNGASTRRIAYYNGSAHGWYLRSVAGGSNNVCNNVYTDGSGTGFTVYNSGGVRPAFIIPSDTLIDSSGNIVLE